MDGLAVKDLFARIEGKIEKIPESGCWIWTGNLSHDGYPYMHVWKRKRYMHRICFELEYGREIPDGETLDHLCRVRCCVNPFHMQQVSLADNIARGNYGWRGFLTHCKRGHPLSGENIYLWHNVRICRACRKQTAEERANSIVHS